LETSYNQPTFASVVVPVEEINPKNGDPIITGWHLSNKPFTHGCEKEPYCQDSGGAFGHPTVYNHVSK